MESEGNWQKWREIWKRKEVENKERERDIYKGNRKSG